MAKIQLYELSLQVNVSGWFGYTHRKLDPGFLPFAETVWKRDSYACRFCGFHATEYQEVVNLDGDYTNNALDNMVTACCFCSQCLFLSMVGKQDYGGGVLVYLPEMTQNDLNGLCHVLFCAIDNATEYQSNAQTILNDLRLRAQPIDEKFGKGLSNPSLLGQMLVDTPMEHRDAVIEKTLKPLRLLPLRKKFEQQLRAWAASAMNAGKQ